MSGPDLAHEWATLCRHHTAQEGAVLSRLGVPAHASVCTPGAGLLVSNIITSGEHFSFAPTGEGRLAWITATDWTNDGPVDLSGFSLREPGRWWLRRGVAVWLGSYQLDRRSVTGLGGAPLMAPPTMPAGYTDSPLLLHRDPLGWLRAGCVGAVPLVPEALDDLRRLDVPVVVEDRQHRDWLEREMRIPRQKMPSWIVPTQTAREAA